ncbi:tight adherence pilus pseudopilin TadF [Vibrio chagasii]|uniref:ATP-binding protein n=1 Tax=Vibrio chagasii TaxID=170679 RepID=A0A7Y3YSP0_9VIBR|nr:tight adherence pilus pseudopilin TadF [Vibrio chagasii]NOH36016.1 ATP-binding protein [Vibrio chagasii]
MHLKSKQKGAFTIELAMIGVLLSLLWVFSADVITKMSVKGKLDRLSYSMVNVLKERTQLYDSDLKVTWTEAKEVRDITLNSLKRTMGSFEEKRLGVLVEEVTFARVGGAGKLSRFPLGANRCEVNLPLNDLRQLSVETIWKRQASLYRITLCYRTDNWIGSLLDIDEFKEVGSSSVIIGR